MKIHLLSGSSSKPSLFSSSFSVSYYKFADCRSPYNAYFSIQTLLAPNWSSRKGDSETLLDPDWSSRKEDLDVEEGV